MYYHIVYTGESIVSTDSKLFSDCYREIYLLENAWRENGRMVVKVRPASNGRFPDTISMSLDIFEKFLVGHAARNIEDILGQEIEGFACERTHRPRGFL